MDLREVPKMDFRRVPKLGVFSIGRAGAGEVIAVIEIKGLEKVRVQIDSSYRHRVAQGSREGVRFEGYDDVEKGDRIRGSKRKRDQELRRKESSRVYRQWRRDVRQDYLCGCGQSFGVGAQDECGR